MTIPIIEIFNSIEGEGIRSGKLCTFIRIAGCNLRCSYCDTKYSFNVADATQMTVEQILEHVESYRCDLITLTGGEPLLNKEVINRLLPALLEHGYQVNVETNGSIDISTIERSHNLMFTIDWKSPSSGMEDKMLPTNLVNAARHDVIKFVVGDLNDLIAMNRVLKTYDIKAHVYVSPVFGNIELADIVQFMKDNRLNGVTLQIQLHKVIWPVDMRGV